MPDRISAEVRSRTMAAVQGKGTRPERLLRAELTALGLTEWTCNSEDLPGKPDIVFAERRLVVFVDGAFWHGHPSKYWQGRSGPYWDRKIARNQARDVRIAAELAALGWTVLRLWDFEVERDPGAAARRVQELLTEPPALYGRADAEPPAELPSVAERGAAYGAEDQGDGSDA